MSPLASLVLAWGALAVPLALADRAAPGSPARKGGEIALRAVVFLALAWAAVLAVWYAFVIRRSIGSMDFFLHVCSARDMFDGRAVEGSGVLASYRLFPGVFVFWRGAMHVFGTSLADLQWAYVALLALDAALAGAIVARATRSLEASFFAALWVTCILWGLEGRQGHLEPIALAPTLAGVLAWSGEPLRGRAGVARALALGAGFGLALFSRQQAGTLAVGALALLPGLVVGEPEKRHRFAPVALVPVAAIVAFALGLAWEGQGLFPLRRGLAYVTEYPGRSSFVENVTGLWPWVKPAHAPLALGFLALVIWTVELARPARRARAMSPAGALAGLCAVSAAATLVQLARRPYVHYLQLTAPVAAIAAIVTVARLWPELPARVRESLLARWALVLVAASFFVVEPERPDRLALWPPAPIPASTAPLAWERIPEVAADLEELASVVRPGEDVLIVPPYRDEVHFLLGTRCDAYDEGYFMDMIPDGMLPHVRWERPFSVLVLTRGDREWLELWKSQQCDAFLAALPGRGFVEAKRLRTMTLYRR